MTAAMRAVAICILMVLVGSCGPSSQQVRARRVAQSRTEAQQRAGARQALAYAEAVHTSASAGDYKKTPNQLALDTSDAIRVLDLAIPNAGVDAATLVAWRGQMFLDAGHPSEARAEYLRSWQMAPNKRAGYVLIGYHGSRNEPQRVSEYCNAMVELMTGSDDRLDLIATCRKQMNAATPEGEMAWMSPELVTWYQTENARRLEAQIDYQNQLAAQQREENRVVRRAESCSLGCKERGLRCQNDCEGDQACENRCVEINHACVDRCVVHAKAELGE
jgi:hypothetical protein